MTQTAEMYNYQSYWNWLIFVLKLIFFYSFFFIYFFLKLTNVTNVWVKHVLIVQVLYITHLNLGTTFHITENSDSGDIADLFPCHNDINVRRSSSTKNLQKQKWCYF